MTMQAGPNPFERWIRGVLTTFTAPSAIRIDKGEVPYVLQPFSGQSGGVQSSANPLVLAGSGGGSVQFQVPNDCEIELDDWKATSSAITSSTPAGAPLGFLVDIAWNGNQIKLTPNPTPAEFIFSTSNSYRAPWSPWSWIITWRTGAGNAPQASFSNLTFQLTNTLTTTNTIYFALMGWNRLRASRG